MKKTMIVLLAVALLLPAAAVFAADSAWTGEVLDLSCYEKGQHGERHASCANRCLGSGAAMGLLVNGEPVNVDAEKSDAAAIEFMKTQGGHAVEVTGTLSEGENPTLVVKTAKKAG